MDNYDTACLITKLFSRKGVFFTSKVVGDENNGYEIHINDTLFRESCHFEFFNAFMSNLIETIKQSDTFDMFLIPINRYGLINVKGIDEQDLSSYLIRSNILIKNIKKEDLTYIIGTMRIAC